MTLKNQWRGNNDTLKSLLCFIKQIQRCCDEIRVSNIIRKDGFSVNPQQRDDAEPMYMNDYDGYTIIHNPAALGFVNYYLIPTPSPIILNWNIDSKVSEQVCENDLANRKIHTVKCLVSGDISLSWNKGNIINLN